ncbi:MAG TPA: sirohydrochlorin chelatase [Roseiflexaceae bacterium]|nr:sirohydrochlorin chelatase [Roseiflexaceae bacterium]
MRAVILIGHGSLRAGSGAAMIRLAARVRAAGVAPVAAAAFLNYSRPTFSEALARVAARGADEAVVQPYFLVPGHYVRVSLPRLVMAGQQMHPQIRIRLAEPLGDHPALAELVRKRAVAADPTASALLLVAHGSPDPSANQSVVAVAARVRERGNYAAVEVCYLGLNQPLLGAAIDEAARSGMARIVVAPYFLQLGGHVAGDLPRAIESARRRHPGVAIALAEHLAYDPLLVPAIATRVREADQSASSISAPA